MPDERGEFITKKELLDKTRLSYGRLYRWKRMHLIPESWFIKRSSFTGQETVFPRHKILDRVARIQELKDGYSLEEVAKLLSPDWGTKRYEPRTLDRLGLPVEIPAWLSALWSGGGDGTRDERGSVSLKFSDLVALKLARVLGEDPGIGSADREVAVKAVATGLQDAEALDDVEESRVMVVARGAEPGLPLGVVVNGSARLHFFPGAEVRIDRSLMPVIDEVRKRLQGWID